MSLSTKLGTLVASRDNKKSGLPRTSKKSIAAISKGVISVSHVKHQAVHWKLDAKRTDVMVMSA